MEGSLWHPQPTPGLPATPPLPAGPPVPAASRARSHPLRPTRHVPPAQPCGVVVATCTKCSVWLRQPAHWGVYVATTIQNGLIRMRLEHTGVVAGAAGLPGGTNPVVSAPVSDWPGSGTGAGRGRIGHLVGAIGWAALLR